MITDLDLAEYALEAYSAPADVETKDVHAIIRERNGVQVIALRGTNPKNLIDLALDAKAWEERDDPILGPCTAVFVADAEQIAWRLWPLLKDPYALTGHSKAANEAQALAVIFKHMGRPPVRLTVFEPPQVGKLNNLADDVPGNAYRHGEDLITDFPLERGQAQPLKVIPWIGHVPLDLLAYHSMQGVYDALKMSVN